MNQISVELEKGHELHSVVFDIQRWADGGGLLKRLQQLALMVWNPASLRTVRDAITEFRPDVILLHNIMPVGSAVLYFHLSRCGIPLVHYIHNFRPFSVNGYCWGNGRLLPQGLQQNFFLEILAGAWQDSIFKTAWYGFLIWLQHRLGVYKRIHGWIAISNFMKERFIEGGIEESRIQVISHSWRPQCSFADLPVTEFGENEPAFLFLGRLSDEKGLRILLNAWEIFEKSSPNGHLMIAGDGPMKEEVRQRCEGMRHASYLGFQTGDAKAQLLRDCTALIVPSIWWEPSGLVLYEAYDYGKPVLAARSGGIVDHVEDGITGWLHEPGDIAMLAAQMLEAGGSSDACRTRGMNGRKYLLERGASIWIQEFDAFVGRIVAEEKCKNADHLPPHPEAEANEAVTPYRDTSPKFKIQNPKSPPRPFPLGELGDLAVQPSSPVSNLQSPISLSVYLADQNPGHGRSFGISRMSKVILDEMAKREDLGLKVLCTLSSLKGPEKGAQNTILPWSTRSRIMRLLTDQLHPVLAWFTASPDIWYFPKGFLPRFNLLNAPTVVTVHDTIIQYYQDHHPGWRKPMEYAYWNHMLTFTLKHADAIFTVSEISKKNIRSFMLRQGLPEKEILVTYEPCFYEQTPQPEDPPKKDYVVHLASREPHKHTHELIRWWTARSESGETPPMLTLVGQVPPESEELIEAHPCIRRHGFLGDDELQTVIREARALILASEIEGFGLPAIEAYYLGTPVCFVKGTSVEEILGESTSAGAFRLTEPDSLWDALDQVLAMPAQDVRRIGLQLRERFAAAKVVDRMIEGFRSVTVSSGSNRSNRQPTHRPS